MFGIKEPSYEKVAERLAREFDLEAVAITVREMPSVWRNTWTAIVYARGEVFPGPRFDIEIVDRVGLGMCSP
ncbi:MAG TPA: sugar kinase, partial [Candidatus Acetothermia bacterium]|nr:sugar kinase [Candidatus Acetothermia bacterium]